jgi:hypothetical protein
MSHQFYQKKNTTKLLIRYFKDFILNFSQIKSNLSNHKLLICFIAAPSDTLLSWCRHWRTDTRRRRKRQRENCYQTFKSKIKSNLKSTIIVKYISQTPRDSYKLAGSLHFIACSGCFGPKHHLPTKTTSTIPQTLPNMVHWHHYFGRFQSVGLCTLAAMAAET